MNNNTRNNQSQRQTFYSNYTYHLPYGIRRSICNLLDADQSWRTLGGQYIGLDTTQLTLLGQAYMRNGSPTDELLNKLDSANVRIAEFCFYLKQMNHYRALEILKPYMIDELQTNHQDEVMNSTKSTTLDTPNPSFADLPAAIMGLNELNPFNYNAQQPDSQFSKYIVNQKESTQACHRNGGQILTDQASSLDQQRVNKDDPGEEIVRMACANNRKRTSISDQEVVNQLRLIMQITYNELKQASNDFSDSNVLGNGGFASVYRGNWKGTDVAIKRLKCNLMDQALNELTILNSYRIDNILPIYGISIDGPEACLVYQFMSNGSLEDRLSCKKGTQPLSWNQRALIGEGVAKGLYYLHTLRDKPLVHGDVKSANVLLDSQFVPKLGDFGLARQVFKGKNPQTELCTHCTVSSIHGTSVYLPPEYLRHKILSPAVDVYSYGIVLLEMATGKRAYDGKRLLIDLVEDETSSMSIGQIGYGLKDSRIADESQNDLRIWFELLIKLGLNCAHKIKKKRPDMGQVLGKFSEFRKSSELSYNIGVKPLTSASFSSTSNSNTTRTLTQDHANNHLENSLIANKTDKNPGHSSLMVVEEESTTDQNNEERQDEAVEAMIPLLTELGVIAKED